MVQAQMHAVIFNLMALTLSLSASPIGSVFKNISIGAFLPPQPQHSEPSHHHFLHAPPSPSFFFLAWLSGSHLTHCHFHLVHTQPAARVSLLKWKSNHVMVLNVLMSFHLIWNPYIESDMTFFLSYHRLSVSNSASAMLVPWCCLYMTSRFVPRFS